jgi:GrpB-like predicted nucleotidyltransferase (UPF0157 family)
MTGKERRSRNAPLTEEQLRAVTIGEVAPLHGTILLAPYNPEWPAMFARLAKQIRDLLGARVLLLEHVGSTSIPALSAKPIIDMVLAVEDSTDEISYVPPLAAAGYVLKIREPDWFEHRLLKSPVIDGNLHVFSRACEEIDRMLAFRDRLRSSDADRKLYERVKQELAARRWKYVQNYADAKSDVVTDILTRAHTSSRL